jgi:hypothetical protein
VAVPPLPAGGKTGASAPAQTGLLHLLQHAFLIHRLRRRERLSRSESAPKQHVAAPHLVIHPEEFGRPIVHGNLFAHQADHFGDALPRYARDRTTVDQQGRALVAHAGTRGDIHKQQAVLGNPAGFDPQLAAQFSHQLRAALHAVGYVVGKQNPVSAAASFGKEGIKADDAAHLGQRQLQFARNERQHCQGKFAH